MQLKVTGHLLLLSYYRIDLVEKREPIVKLGSYKGCEALSSTDRRRNFQEDYSFISRGHRKIGRA